MKATQSGAGVRPVIGVGGHGLSDSDFDAVKLETQLDSRSNIDTNAPDS